MFKLSYGALNDAQKNFIKKKGQEVFNSIKNFEQPETRRSINEWLKPKGLIISVPDLKFLNKNKIDVQFALDNLPLSSRTKNKLEESQSLITLQIGFPESKTILLFHEIDGDKQTWSLVNMFDNNLMLWLDLINETLENPEFKEFLKDHPKYREGLERNVNFILTVYFGSADTETFAAHNLLRAMLMDRKKIFTTIFDKTWGGGQEVEKNFFSYLGNLSVSDDDIKLFSGEGNFVDRVGIDCALKNISKKLKKKIDKDWVPVQIKPKFSDALKAIPYSGISVFPNSGVFYYCENTTDPPKKVDELFKELEDN